MSYVLSGGFLQFSHAQSLTATANLIISISPFLVRMCTCVSGDQKEHRLPNPEGAPGELIVVKYTDYYKFTCELNKACLKDDKLLNFLQEIVIAQGSLKFK